MAPEIVTFELFRLRLHERMQLFTPQISRRQALLGAIDSKTVLTYRDHQWRIGDVTRLDEDGMYFSFGRKSNLNVIGYDSTSESFADGQIDNWPFSHIFLDARIGLVAISRNSRLSRISDSTANRLKEIISSYPSINDFWDVELKAIPDPIQFIAKLERAFSIKRFAFEFWRPNPFDVDEELQKPLENYLLEANGIKGEVEIEGANLKADIIKEQARSAISSSTSTRAVIQEERGGPVIHISSFDNKFETKEIGFDADSTTDLLRSLEVIREIYQSIRTG